MSTTREDAPPVVEGEQPHTSTTQENGVENGVETGVIESHSEEAPNWTAEDATKKFEEAKVLFNEDKYAEASDLFGDVSNYLVAKHGELALECAECYYLYGRSLFLQAKSESSVFGAQPQQQKTDEDEDSDDEEDAPPAESEKPEGEEGKSIEKPEDVEGIQVAWETLEVARLIYEKHPEKAAELSDTRYALAEIFLETDNCNDAVDEFLKCISLREQIFAPNDRRIAAAPADAHLHYSKAADVLDAKLKSLPQDSEEVEDIKCILEDLAAKMEEVDPNLLAKEATERTAAPTTTTTTTTTTTNGKGKQAVAESSSTPAPNPFAATFETGFAAPIFDPKTQPITRFGVVGSSVKRSTPVTAPASSSSSSSASSSSSSSSNPSSSSSSSSSSSPAPASRPALSTSGEKRKLDSLMGGEEGFEKRTKTSDTVCETST